jgi:hypothetical protein
MKKVALAAAIAATASTAFAGGVEPTMDVGVITTTTSSSSAGIIVPLLLLVVLGVALSQ